MTTVIRNFRSLLRVWNGLFSALRAVSAANPRRIFRRTALKAMPPDGAIVLIPQTGARMRVFPDRWISQSWFVRGDFETAEVCYISSVVRPGMCCIDVGANEGFYTLLMGRLVGKSGLVHAYEPTPSTYAQLMENIATNGYTQINAMQLAIGDRTGRIEFQIGPPSHSVYNSIGKIRHAGARGERFETISVSCATLDQIVPQGAEVHLAKIDVEGLEHAVIDGMKETILRSPKIRLIFECNRSEEAGFDAIAWLAAQGFRFYRLGRYGRPREINPTDEAAHMMLATRGTP